MAKRVKAEEGSTGTTTEQETNVLRQKADYCFEFHGSDGSITPIGLVLNYPSEADKVKAFFNSNNTFEAMGEGTVRVCKKIYN